MNVKINADTKLTSRKGTMPTALRSVAAQKALMEYALRLLGRRAYTVHQLEDKLRKRARVNESTEESTKASYDGAPMSNPSEGMVVAVLEQLNAWGYLDDLRYCKAWVEERCRLKPRGKYALDQELRLKGVPDSTRKLFWATEYGEAFDERQLVEKMLQQKLPRLQRSRKESSVRQSCYRLLVARGFSHDVVRTVIDAWEGDLDKVDG
jgi:SOS response regulatory protein OraA/RecX